MISKEEVQSIIEATDTVALVSKYVDLEKKGKNYVACCPFHTEKTGSFTVSPEKHMAKCFGCGAGGTVLDFLMQIENLDFPHALKKLADFNGMKIDLNIKSNENPKFKKYYEIMDTAVNFYKTVLHKTNEGKKAIDYLLKRGLKEETIEKLNIGLAPDIGNSLYNVLTESGYLELDIEDLGLISKKDNGYFDTYANRIMFPIYDENNNPIAFSGRIYRDIDKDSPKYVNTKETDIFKKKEVLFNLNNAKNEIRQKKRAILHEGQMDVLASYQSGLGEAVCSLGTALNKEAVLKLKKYTQNVIICYDGDSAGIRASIKAIKLFKEYNFDVKLVLLPNGMDPDEYTKKFGYEGYNKFFNSNIIDAYEYQYKVLFIDKNLNDNQVKEQIKNEAFGVINDIRSNTLVDEYLKKLANDLHFDLNLISNDFNFYKRTHASKNYTVVPNYQEYQPEIEVKPVEVNPKKNLSICECRLFIFAKSSKEKALYIDKRINDIMGFGFSYDTQILWIKLINDFYLNYDYFDEAIFIKMLDSVETANYLNLLEAVRNSSTPYDDEDMNRCILKIKEISCEKEILDISSRVSKINDPKNKIKLIARQYELKRNLKEVKELLKQKPKKNI